MNKINPKGQTETNRQKSKYVTDYLISRQPPRAALGQREKREKTNTRDNNKK